MMDKPYCFGYWIECPKDILFDDIIKRTVKRDVCLIAPECHKDWGDYGGRIGLEDIEESMK